jgi:hypothetical protein
MIIDTTYFVGKLNLPQTGNTEGTAIVDGFIQQYEPELLLKALGPGLFQAFTDEVYGSGSGDIEQRFLDLLDGVSFSYNNTPFRWVGFRNTAKRSPIANYVYYKFLEDLVNSVALTGVVESMTDNNRNVSHNYKMVEAWNDQVYLLNHLWAFLYTNKAVYPEWTEYNYPGIIGWTYPFNCERNEVYKTINTFGI